MTAESPREYDARISSRYEFDPVCEISTCDNTASHAIQCTACGDVRSLWCHGHATFGLQHAPGVAECGDCHGTAVHHSVLYKAVPLGAWLLKGGTMNAVERLNAAIEKLETLKAESTPGRWVSEDESFNGPFVRAWFDNEFNGNTGIAGMRHGMADADLIVTLHRTIDAQLAILYRGLTSVAPEREVAEMLASAILGES